MRLKHSTKEMKNSYISQRFKSRLMHLSMDEWKKKMCIVTMEYYSAVKKDEVLSFVTI